MKPAGTEIAGNPAKFTGTVNKSAMYIAIGSSLCAPNPNAAEVVTGPKIKS